MKEKTDKTENVLGALKGFAKTYPLASFLFVLLLLVVFATQFVFLCGRVASASMEPTLMVGEYIVHTRLGTDRVKNGDIIIFKHNYEYVGKRVIGIPGDTVEFKDGYVYLNGEKLIEPYVPEGTVTASFKDFEVPEGCVFVLGDNREISDDSRFWQEPFVNISDIKGVYLFKISIGN